MADYCPLCFEKAEFLHLCGGPKSSNGSIRNPVDGSEKFSLTSVVMVAPIMGIFLDLFVPLPSAIIVSLVISVIGSALISCLWVAVKYDGNKSFRFFIRNLKNFLYTPNLLKIFGSDNHKRITPTWLGFIALSTTLQILLFTPGNSFFIEKTISNKIKKESGVNLAVDCPSTQIYFYQEPITCRVKTGILGISVPARVTLSPIVGTFTIKVSLL